MFYIGNNQLEIVDQYKYLGVTVDYSVSSKTNSIVQVVLLHPTGGALSSDWSVKSFIIVVYVNIFFNFSQNLLSKVGQFFFS